MFERIDFDRFAKIGTYYDVPFESAIDYYEALIEPHKVSSRSPQYQIHAPFQICLEEGTPYVLNTGFTLNLKDTCIQASINAKTIGQNTLIPDKNLTLAFQYAAFMQIYLNQFWIDRGLFCLREPLIYQQSNFTDQRTEGEIVIPVATHRPMVIKQGEVLAYGILYPIMSFTKHEPNPHPVKVSTRKRKTKETKEAAPNV